MKVFKIGGKKKRGDVDLGSIFDLPQVHCNECGQTWGEGMLDFPALSFSFFNANEFNFQRVVSVSEFNAISDKICQAAKRKILLVPGASLGPLVGRSFNTKLDDFIWGRIPFPQISLAAKDALEKNGISLNTAKIELKYRGKPINSHLALQIEPAIMMTEESLMRYSIRHCKVCGEFRHMAINPRVPEGYVLDQSKWPEGAHLVTMLETLDVLVSPEFIETVERENLSGLTFEECGRFNLNSTRQP